MDLCAGQQLPASLWFIFHVQPKKASTLQVEKYVNPSQIELFADDVVLWCSDANISKMESQLNRSLINIQEFADNHKIAFNASKSTTSTPKHSNHPELLKQLALEVINDIPDLAFTIYTDGSRSGTGRAGSGIFSNTPGNDVKISIKNSDHSSVFRLELIAIIGALYHALNSYNDSFWILTDSRSSI
ncbi:RNase H domain-containing protein [Trichonephila clavipes]|nr:RNase H domain-containing protein [Trichonephila clavipes]